MRARYYNPQIKCFINQDTMLGSIANIQSLNRYAYTKGNPINYIDTTGRSRVISGLGWVSAICGAAVFGVTIVEEAPLEGAIDGVFIAGAIACFASAVYMDRIDYANKPRDTEYAINQDLNILGMIPVFSAPARESITFGYLALHAGFGGAT